MSIEVVKSRREQLTQVAILYYEEGLNQSTVAKRIGKSRSMISRMLTEARNAGLVEIKINAPLNRNSDAESRLLKMSNLHGVWVLDSSMEGPVSSKSLFSKLAAEALLSKLHNDVKIGIAWSRTLHGVLTALPRLRLENASVVQLSGSVAVDDNRYDGPELVRILAEKINADYRYLMAPLIVQSRVLRESLVREQTIAETLRLAAEVDVAVIGVGSIRLTRSDLRDAGSIPPEMLRRLLKSEMVGDIIGHQFTLRGRELDDEINTRIVGIPLRELARISTTIAVAHGAEKAATILGGMRGGWFNHLVTDMETAEAMFEIADGDTE